MSDPIQVALNKANTTIAGATTNQINSAITSAASKIPTDKLGNLPTTKNPELIKKQIEAEIEKKKVEAEEIRLQIQEEGIELAKDKLKELAIQALPTIALPVIDPKILQAVALANQAKELIKQRTELSKKNLDNINKKLEFPMKVPDLQTPAIPEIPKIPEIPGISLPNIPNIR